ncbi:MAG: NAD-dependent epimerase/dehydratase family protein [Actinobacteria bacterium]|nr:NAD-dependent epimerase/dehydratase family protein [Actinomycetota bacterium]
MRIVVTGAGGQLGSELIESATGRGHDVIATTRASLDVTNRDATISAIRELRPDVIMHAAAWTAVDACESYRDRAMRDNGAATRNVVEAARASGARVMYVSTDYVFDGTKPTPYVETDTPNPTSVYGESKLAGERAPSFADDVAEGMVTLVERGVTGIWHLTNQGVVSWYEFAREVVALCGGDPEMVKPIATSQLNPPRPAKRPANSVLDNAAMRSAGFPMLDDFRVPLARLVRRLRG